MRIPRTTRSCTLHSKGYETYLTGATAETDGRYDTRYSEKSPSDRYEQECGALGRTQLPNDGSVVVGARSLTMSSRSTSAISAGLVLSIWPIVTKTAHTSAWTRPRRPGDPSNYVPWQRAVFSLDLESAVFITATIGRKPPDP